ncbi:MAG: AAA family ATPase [Candidatus Sericytochromatia bacterium]
MDKLISNIDKIAKNLKEKFVSKDNIIDVLIIGLIAGENVFLFGPPGTAKSAIVNELANLINGKTFEYLLTKFTEPNELFGPFDIRKLKEGELITNTAGMLPEANFIFLDELLNANSSILNSLLMVLNEKVFRRGQELKKLPILMTVGASNHLPEDEALQALFDRFLLRVNSDNVSADFLLNVLDSGWELEKNRTKKDILEKKETYISIEDLFLIQKQIFSIDLTMIKNEYLKLIQNLKNSGIVISDRRAVKLQKLISASALICNRKEAIISDLWVLKYIWDNQEQIEIIENLVDSVINQFSEENNIHHPRAFIKDNPNPDEILKDILALKEKWDDINTSLEDKAIIKDKLRHLNGRIYWIKNQTQKIYLEEEINNFWNKIILEN